ncbi:hypothetical protein C8J57DRAFT_1371764 [Mycena rebaudengoi]|nr:hypothetical protein C8J57DRAFT_1371764 [Mycena rebaudengoi]
MIRSSGSPPAKRKTKPPACDACKARRVLCHPQPHGLPCPRCAEKGLICKTNPVPRGRPRTKPLPSALATSSSPASPQQPQSGPSNIPSSYNSLVVVQPSFELSSFWDLPAGLVKHLYESFTNAYQYHRHPLLRNCDLRDTLAAAGWKLCLLHPEARVLAYCACAVSSLISFHSDVIGPGPQPGSFIDASVFFLGANLQSYGMRRAPVFRALHERAVSLACDTRIYLHTSVYNAASCFLLESMEGISSDDSSSRPWATACLSHVRSLAGSWNTVDNLRGLWSAFLMLESLTATARRKPILISHSDQLLITGNEPPPLETVFEQAQASVRASKNPAAYLVFSAIRPYMFHVTRLSRELHDKIKGDHARRHPIAEGAVISFLSSLELLKSMISLFFGQDNFPSDGPISRWAPLGHPKPQADEAENIRTCAYAMSVGFTGLALALHREMEYRTAVDERTGTQTQSQWQRTAMLRHQAHEMATRAVDDVPRTLPLLPSPPYNVYVDWAGILGWAEFCLDEADAVGGVSPARIVVFERIMETLKTLGYSRNDPRAVAYIERMGAHAAAYRMAAAYSADQHFAVPDMFAPDNTWMRMLLE